MVEGGRRLSLGGLISKLKMLTQPRLCVARQERQVLGHLYSNPTFYAKATCGKGGFLYQGQYLPTIGDTSSMLRSDPTLCPRASDNQRKTTRILRPFFPPLLQASATDREPQSRSPTYMF